jgi:hypothetical protein
MGASGCAASSGVIRARKSPANEPVEKRVERRDETPKHNISLLRILMIFFTSFVFRVCLG